MQVKTTRLNFFDGLELKEATFNRKKFPEHFHDTYSIGILEEGLENLVVEGKPVQMHAHSMIIINPHQLHAHSFVDNDNWKYKAIYINPDVFKYALIKNNLPSESLPQFSTELITDTAILKSFRNIYHQPKKNIETELFHIITKLIDNYSIKKSINNSDEKTSCQMLELKNNLEENYFEKINLEKLALRYQLSKFQLIRQFKKYTGLTPVSFQLLQRIHHSKKLLSKNTPLVEAALEVGFFDQSHFSHYFKKYIGVSPLEYKKGIQQID